MYQLSELLVSSVIISIGNSNHPHILTIICTEVFMSLAPGATSEPVPMASKTTSSSTGDSRPSSTNASGDWMEKQEGLLARLTSSIHVLVYYIAAGECASTLVSVFFFLPTPCTTFLKFNGWG